MSQAGDASVQHARNDHGDCFLVQQAKAGAVHVASYCKKPSLITGRDHWQVYNAVSRLSEAPQRAETVKAAVYAYVLAQAADVCESLAAEARAWRENGMIRDY